MAEKTIKVTVSKETIKYRGVYYEPDREIEIFESDQEIIDLELVTPVARAAEKQNKETDEHDPTLPPEDDLTEISGIGEETALTLKNAGIKTFDDLAEAKPVNLAKLHGITEKKAKAFIKAANEAFEPED